MRLFPRPFLAAALALPFAAIAGPEDYVQVPTVSYGERELDFKAGSWILRGDEPGRQSAASLAFGYAGTTWWSTEVYMKYERTAPERFKYDAFEWENKFQLTEPNQYFVDVGLLTEIEIPRERRVEGYELRAGPLLQWDTGAVRWNGNLFLERVMRGESDAPRHTELSYQLQAKIGVAHGFEVGAQAFGELGPWNHWDPGREQSHRIGPAIFGKVKLEGRQAIKYNAALLFPLTDATPRSSVRLQAEYEF